MIGVCAAPPLTGGRRCVCVCGGGGGGGLDRLDVQDEEDKDRTDASALISDDTTSLSHFIRQTRGTKETKTQKQPNIHEHTLVFHTGRSAHRI